MIIESKVKDPEKYGQYISKVPSIVAKYSGRYLCARRQNYSTIRRRMGPERMIVLEFPSEAHIREWLSSPEYQAIAPLREAGAEIKAVLLEGYQQED